MKKIFILLRRFTPRLATGLYLWGFQRGESGRSPLWSPSARTCFAQAKYDKEIKIPRQLAAGYFYFIIIFTLILTACKQPDLTDSQNNPIHLSDYRGKWLVVNYWATWCQPCVYELPELNGLYLSHRDHVMVFAVNFDGLPQHEINQFIQRLHLQIPFFSQFPTEKYGITEISALPVTFIISPDGKLTKTLHGPQTQASLGAVISSLGGGHP